MSTLSTGSRWSSILIRPKPKTKTSAVDLYSYSDLFDASPQMHLPLTIQSEIRIRVHREIKYTHKQHELFSTTIMYNWIDDKSAANQCSQHTESDEVDVWLSCDCHIEPAIESIIWMPTSPIDSVWICYLLAERVALDRRRRVCLNQCKNTTYARPFNGRKKKRSNGMSIETTNQFSYANYGRVHKFIDKLTCNSFACTPDE